MYFTKTFKKTFFKIYFQTQGKGGKKREREREALMCGCLSQAPYWGLRPNLGVCPNWKLNQRPFGSQASTEFTELHQPGLY